MGLNNTNWGEDCHRGIVHDPLNLTNTNFDQKDLKQHEHPHFAQEADGRNTKYGHTRQRQASIISLAAVDKQFFVDRSGTATDDTSIRR